MESKKQKTYDNKGSLYRFSDGFTWKIVSKKEAEVLFNKNQEVFGLNTEEETEGVIEKLSDLETYEVFAIEHDFANEMQYSHQIGKYVRAYYNESISNDDNGYQVNLMFYNNEYDDDYFDEEFITTNSPKKATALADKINEEGHEKFMPKQDFKNIPCVGKIVTIDGLEYQII